MDWLERKQRGSRVQAAEEREQKHAERHQNVVRLGVLADSTIELTEQTRTLCWPPGPINAPSVQRTQPSPCCSIGYSVSSFLLRSARAGSSRTSPTRRFAH